MADPIDDILYEKPKAAAPAGGVDIDSILYGAKEPEAPARDVSKAESLGFGALKGGTFGTAPAIAKAGGALASTLPTSMRQWLVKKTTGVDIPAEAVNTLDQQGPEFYRQAYLNSQGEAQKANPKTFLLGELAGAAVVPVPGASAVRGATTVGGKLAARAAQGAGTGALFGGGEAIGEGASLGETLERAGQGALTGAAIAPVVGAVGDKVGSVASKLLQKRAEKRMIDQAIKDLAGSKETGLSKPTDRRMMAKAADALRDELRDPEAIKIADAARKDPGKAWEMVQKRVDAVTADKAASYAAVDAETGGFRVKELRRFLADELGRLGKEPGQTTERHAVDAMIKDIDDTWGQQLAPTIPTQKLRQYVTKLQRVAADTMGGLEETRRVQILDHVSGLAKTFLDNHLDDAAKLDPGLKPVVDALREQNRRVAAWLSVEDALKTRASKLETNNMVDNKPKALMAGLGAAAGAVHFLHSPVMGAIAGAAGVAPYVAPPIDRAITRGLARMTPVAQANMAPVSQVGTAAAARAIQARRAGVVDPALQEDEARLYGR